MARWREAWLWTPGPGFCAAWPDDVPALPPRPHEGFFVDETDRRTVWPVEGAALAAAEA